MTVERFIEETRDASPANLLIKFESFSSFAKYGIAQYESRAFEAGGYKWKMIMYPEGYESEKEECHVSVHFAIVETDSLPLGWKVNAIFAFFVYNHHKDNYLCFRGMTRRFDALVRKRGFSKLISKKTLIDPSKGYLIDDCCQFGAEVFVIKNQLVNECLSLVKDTSPFRREWKISGFSELGYVWNSEEFVVGNHTWQVKVFTKEKLAGPKGLYISIYLDCVDAEEFGPHQTCACASKTSKMVPTTLLDVRLGIVMNKGTPEGGLDEEDLKLGELGIDSHKCEEKGIVEGKEKGWEKKSYFSNIVAEVE